jgi:membrane protein required for colicin V production
VSIADVIVLLALALSGFLALTRGLVREVLAIVTWGGAAAIAFFGFQWLQPIGRSLVKPGWLADVVIGLGLFILAFLLISLVSRPIEARIRDSQLRGLDRGLGLLFGLVRGAALICLAYLAMSWVIPAADMPSWVKEAKSRPAIEQGTAMLRTLIPRGAAQGDAKSALDALGAPQSKDAASELEKGYKNDERQDLDRLIQTTK